MRLTFWEINCAWVPFWMSYFSSRNTAVHSKTAILLFPPSLHEVGAHAMLWHCFTAYTLTEGIISHFPYLSMALCVCAQACVCEWYLLFHVTDGLPQQQFTWGSQNVTFGCDNLHTSQEFFGVVGVGVGGVLLNWMDSRSAQVHWQEVPWCSSTKPCQIRLKRAKPNQAWYQKACAEFRF